MAAGGAVIVPASCGAPGDDIQWADPATLRFLDYLGRRIEDLPVLLLMAFRTGEGGTSELAETVAGSGPAEVLEPPPLSATAVAQLIGATFGEPPATEFVDACIAATGGNPFLVAELLATLERDGIGPTRESARSIPLARPRTIVQMDRGQRRGRAAAARGSRRRCSSRGRPSRSTSAACTRSWA